MNSLATTIHITGRQWAYVVLCGPLYLIHQQLLRLVLKTLETE